MAVLAAVPDCERVVQGVLAQPTNALSSLVFLLAGVWVATQARRSPGRRPELVVFGAAIASNAVGGLLYHGELTATTRAVHDTAIVAVVGFVAVFEVARLTAHGWGWTWRAYVMSLASLGALIIAWPAAGYAVFAVLGSVIAGTEVADHLRERPTLRTITRRRLARLAAVLAFGLAATAFFVGRSGAPLCRPDSTMQWHAVWHALAAVAMALFAYSGIEPRRVRRDGTPARI